MAAARFQIHSVVRRGAAATPDADMECDRPTQQGVTWRFLTANNRSLGQSTVVFADVDSCVAAIRNLQRQVHSATGLTLRHSPLQWMWQVRVSEHPLAVSSRRYQRRVQARDACESFLGLIRDIAGDSQLHMMRH